MRWHTAHRRRERRARMAAQRREQILAGILRDAFRQLIRESVKASFQQLMLGEAIRGLANFPLEGAPA